MDASDRHRLPDGWVTSVTPFLAVLRSRQDVFGAFAPRTNLRPKPMAARSETSRESGDAWGRVMETHKLIPVVARRTPIRPRQLRRRSLASPWQGVATLKRVQVAHTPRPRTRRETPSTTKTSTEPCRASKHRSCRLRERVMRQVECPTLHKNSACAPPLEGIGKDGSMESPRSLGSRSSLTGPTCAHRCCPLRTL